MKNNIYHYTECGLDNVYLHNIPAITDCKNNEIIYIPRINRLHRVIAEAIINKKGALNNKEIRFLRTELGCTQADFSILLGKEEQACGRWERGKVIPEKQTDVLIRILVIQMMKLRVNYKIPDFVDLINTNANDNSINITENKSEQYELMAAA